MNQLEDEKFVESRPKVSKFRKILGKDSETFFKGKIIEGKDVGMERVLMSALCN